MIQARGERLEAMGKNLIHRPSPLAPCRSPKFL